MSVRSAVFLSIRDKATRLPGKATADICGRAVIDRLLTRLKGAKEADLIALTTSTHSDDAQLLIRAEEAGVQSFAGSEDDKLQRYLDASRKFGIEFAVVVDGDDLLCSVDHIDAAIRHYRETRADYITQVGLPLGAASYGIRVDALKRVVEAKAESNTEVWGDYFTTRSDIRVSFLSETDPLLRHPNLRMTLDYAEDLAFFRAVYSAYSAHGEPSLPDVMQILRECPEIIELNRAVQTKYEAKLRSSAPVRFRETKI